MSLIDQGRHLVDASVKSGIETWLSEGKIDHQQADALAASLDLPEVERGLMHAGSHFALSMPLPFPFGALFRFTYSLSLRLMAEARALLRRGSASDARRTHTLVVILFALVPGFGRLAYFFSPALAEHRLLLVIPMDQVARKLPGHTYERLHLSALSLYWANPSSTKAGGSRRGLNSALLRIRSRLNALSPYVPALSLVLALDAVIFAIGAFMYLDSGRSSTWWFEEKSVVASLDVVQLLVAAAAGIAAYIVFWRYPREMSTAEAAGIFLWAIGGVGLLVFAIDDYFTVHENLGDVVYAQFGFLPVFTSSLDDLLVIGYAVIGLFVLFAFRMELTARRNSTTLLALAASASVLMVVTDATPSLPLALKAVELPMQTLSVTLLMFAFIARYREVRTASASDVTPLPREAVA